MRAAAQRALAAAIVVGLIVAGAWRLRPSSPGAATRCPRPAALAWRGRTLIACGVPAGGARLGALRRRLGLDHPPACPAADELIVRPRELVRLGPRCAAAAGRMPARQALLLGIKLPLNRATEEELQALPRIGPKLARRVVRLRRRLGAFVRLEQLQRVKGIGPRTVERLRPYVSVVPTSAAR